MNLNEINETLIFRFCFAARLKGRFSVYPKVFQGLSGTDFWVPLENAEARLNQHGLDLKIKFRVVLCSVSRLDLLGVLEVKRVQVNLEFQRKTEV